MRLLTWNINGLRSLEDGLSERLKNLEADVICFQETKIRRDALDSETALIQGYNSYFAFTRKAKGGYSGVATYCKDSCAPSNAEEGLSSFYSNSDSESLVGCYGQYEPTEFLKSLDGEGRAILTTHQVSHQNTPPFPLTLINVYCPRADPENQDRWSYKMQFYRMLESRANQLRASGHHVIIAGDLNISLKPIDSCDPEPDIQGKEHRIWLETFLEESKFVDQFRHFHPGKEKMYTCWRTKLSARETNFGTRIDYLLVDQELLEMNVFENCEILTEVYGSDHCPVLATLNLTFNPPEKLPKLCSKFMPEFRGTQKKLSDFLVRKKTASPPKNRSKIVQQKSLNDFVTVSRPKKTSENVSFCPKEKERQGPKAKATVKSDGWSAIFKPLPRAPLCKGHGASCVLRTVKKPGVNHNRQFYVCAKPEGHKGDPKARCDHFEWKCVK